MGRQAWRREGARATVSRAPGGSARRSEADLRLEGVDQERRERRGWGEDVLDVEELGGNRDAVFGELHQFLFLRHFVVRAPVQRGGYLGRGGIPIPFSGDRVGDDERRSRLVNENGVGLVDDAVVQRGQHHLARVSGQVVPQVVEAELRIGHVRNVTAVGRALLLGRRTYAHHTHAEAQKLVHLSHDLRVAPREVLRTRDHVRAAAGEGVEVSRKGRDERLAFTGRHLRHGAVRKGHAANELHVVMAKSEYPPRGLAHHREGLFQQLINGAPALQPSTELLCLGPERVVV